MEAHDGNRDVLAFMGRGPPFGHRIRIGGPNLAAAARDRASATEPPRKRPTRGIGERFVGRARRESDAGQSDVCAELFIVDTNSETKSAPEWVSSTRRSF